MSLGARYSEVLDGRTAADEDTTISLNASYRYNFGRGLTGTAAYHFLDRNSNGTDDLRENAITLSVRKTF
jgi:uncharacterized protein (PEP-CTERM system associated)